MQDKGKLQIMAMWINKVDSAFCLSKKLLDNKVSLHWKQLAEVLDWITHNNNLL